MHLLKFCTWGYDLPGSARPRWGFWTWVADLGGLAILWHCLAPAAAELGDPRLVIVGGWAASMAAAMGVYCGAQVRSLEGVGRQIFGGRRLAMIPYVVAVSLVPCAIWQWWMAGGDPSKLLPFLGREWEICNALAVVDLLFVI